MSHVDTEGATGRRLSRISISCSIGGHNRSIEIRRIVITRPGEGIVRRALALVATRAFVDHDAHRVWLDTFTWNERAQRAYVATGFVHE